jgi:hypothetical protein
MDHGIDTAKCLRHRLRIANIADDEFGIAVQILRPSAALAMDLWRQAIQDTNRVAFGEKKIGYV